MAPRSPRTPCSQRTIRITRGVNHAATAGYDVVPTASVLTAYDERHATTYLRLLDADTEGADWKEVARIVLRIDPEREPERACL
jgi:hypothetical protein